MEQAVISGEVLQAAPHDAVRLVFHNLRKFGLAILLEPMVSAVRQAQWQHILQNAPRPCAAPEVWLATGGTSGSLRLVRHTLGTLEAAARAYHTRFPEPYRSVCCLPLWHVSGWMQVMRARVAEGQWVAMDYRALEEPERGLWVSPRFGGESSSRTRESLDGESAKVWDSVQSLSQTTGSGLTHSTSSGLTASATGEGWSMSLVPAQLSRLMQSPVAVERLRRFRRIFIGGAALSEALARQARALGLPLSPSYGMTETAAMVAALDPEDFLRGATGCGQALPHARLTVDKEQRILIDAPSTGWGFVPTEPDWCRSPFRTQDLGYFDEHLSLHLTGRSNRVINTGGEKVDAEVLEKALCAVFPGAEFWVTGVPHPHWGEQLVAVVKAEDTDPDPGVFREWVRGQLPPAWRPAHWRFIRQWPYTAAGKLDVAHLRGLLFKSIKKVASELSEC